MATPRPNKETVEVLLDTTWRVTANELSRTEAIDRKASTLTAFAALVTTLVGTLGGRLLEARPWWAVALFVGTLLVLLAAAALAVLALFPREYLTLGLDYLRRFPTWGEIFKQPEDVRGETMQGLIKALANERTTNDRKVRFVKQAYVLLIVGVALAAAQAATLAVTGLL
jgi:hypothetical protein